MEEIPNENPSLHQMPQVNGKDTLDRSMGNPYVR